MELNGETLRFIREHRKDDVRSLALQAPKYPDVDMPVALTQIAGRQAAAEKIPSWHEEEGVLYPRHLSLENVLRKLRHDTKHLSFRSPPPAH